MDIYLIGSAATDNELLQIPHGAHIGVFNSAYLRFRDAEYMFFQDDYFFESIKREDFRKFAGRILTAREFEHPRIERIAEKDLKLSGNKKKFNALGKNTGFHAIAWALNNGYDRVILLGFQCRYERGGMVMPEVIEMWQKQHKELAELGLPIVNLTPDSGIDDIYLTNMDGD